jgi:hypothetical protein
MEIKRIRQAEWGQGSASTSLSQSLDSSIRGLHLGPVPSPQGASPLRRPAGLRLLEESKHLRDQALHDEARRLLHETQRLMSPSRDAVEDRDALFSQRRGTPGHSSSVTYSEAAAHGKRVLGEMDAMLAAPDGALAAEDRAPLQQALALLRLQTRPCDSSSRVRRHVLNDSRCGAPRSRMHSKRSTTCLIPMQSFIDSAEKDTCERGCWAGTP